MAWDAYPVAIRRTRIVPDVSQTSGSAAAQPLPTRNKTATTHYLRLAHFPRLYTPVFGCGPLAMGVRARRERQRAKQTLHAVKLRGGDDFLYDVATAKSASTETSSVGSSAPRERRPLATKLVSVENRLDAEGIPHASHSHAPPRHRACLGGKPFRRRRNPSRVPLTHPPFATELVSVGAAACETDAPRRQAAWGRRFSLRRGYG